MKDIERLDKEIEKTKLALEKHRKLRVLKAEQAKLRQLEREEKRPPIIKDLMTGFKMMGDKIGKGMDNYAANMKDAEKKKKVNYLPEKIDVLGKNKW